MEREPWQFIPLRIQDISPVLGPPNPLPNGQENSCKGVGYLSAKLAYCAAVNGILAGGLPPAENSARPGNEENTQVWVARAVSGASLPAAAIAGFGRFPATFTMGAHAFAQVPGIVGDYFRIAYYKLTLEAMFAVQPRVLRIVFCAFRRRVGTGRLHRVVLHSGSLFDWRPDADRVAGAGPERTAPAQPRCPRADQRVGRGRI